MRRFTVALSNQGLITDGCVRLVIKDVRIHISESDYLHGIDLVIDTIRAWRDQGSSIAVIERRGDLVKMAFAKGLDELPTLQERR